MFRQVPYAAARRSGKANEGGQRQRHRGGHEREPHRACGDQKGERMNGTKGDYAEVNGLRMYYEDYGEGRPLVLLHGAYMTVDAMGSILPGLAESRRVIVPEMQGHGRTADIERHITYESMADDVATLLGHLGIEEADVFGFSMGGGVALQLAIRHLRLVRRRYQGDRGAEHDRRRRRRRRQPRARRRNVPTSGWRRDGRPVRLLRTPTRGAPRNCTLHPAG